MASLMEELIQTLDAEEKCYSQLIPIEEEKTRAIIANDLEALQDITVREHDLVDETSALENKRERLILLLFLGVTRRRLHLNRLHRC